MWVTKYSFLAPKTVTAGTAVWPSAGMGPILWQTRDPLFTHCAGLIHARASTSTNAASAHISSPPGQLTLKRGALKAGVLFTLLLGFYFWLRTRSLP